MEGRRPLTFPSPRGSGERVRPAKRRGRGAPPFAIRYSLFEGVLRYSLFALSLPKPHPDLHPRLGRPLRRRNLVATLEPHPLQQHPSALGLDLSTPSSLSPTTVPGSP